MRCGISRGYTSEGCYSSSLDAHVLRNLPDHWRICNEKTCISWKPGRRRLVSEDGPNPRILTRCELYKRRIYHRSMKTIVQIKAVKVTGVGGWLGRHGEPQWHELLICHLRHSVKKGRIQVIGSAEFWQIQRSQELDCADLAPISDQFRSLWVGNIFNVYLRGGLYWIWWRWLDSF